MFKTIINAWKVPAVRKRLLYTLLLIIVFRFGSHISVPGLDFVKLDAAMKGANQGLLGLVDLITGGAFSRLSIFAMSISPYISASIIVQLMGMLIPSLEMMQKEGGEQGKKKINKYTKIITLVLATVQALGLYLAYSRDPQSSVFVQSNIMTAIAVVSALVAGTMFLVWVGQKITKKGIGNGISMLIFAGIVSSVPEQLISLVTGISSNGQIDVKSMITAVSIFIGTLILITAVVYVHISERKIPVQYSRKIVGRKMYGGQNTFVPIKPVMAGVMPVIFASSFITFPGMIAQLFFGTDMQNSPIANFIANVSLASAVSTSGVGYMLGHAILYMLLIVGFTFFYTLAVFNPAEIASNIRQNGGYIPGIRAGKTTTEFLTNVVIKLTAFGALFLCIIAVLPMLARGFTTFNIAFGGTSILIIVGVAVETVQQLQSQLMIRHYKGFLE